MWQYLALSIARHCYDAPTRDSPNFAEGSAKGGVALTVMNITTVVMSFLIPPIIRAIGTRATYALFLACGGAGFISMFFTNNVHMVYAGMVGVGIGWSAIMTVPFIMTTSVVPASKTGIYMGLLNAFICIPQIMEMLTVPLYFERLLGGDPRNAIVLAGICLLLASVACWFISKEAEIGASTEEVLAAESGE
jgi:maltose/moltooligosaccharide transporter